jgi:hypothetical protein
MSLTGIAFPFKFVDLAGLVGPPPFAIIPNPNFSNLTPVCVVKNLNPNPAAPDDFISITSVGGAPRPVDCGVPLGNRRAFSHWNVAA